ncbi:DUF6455 family protein [Aestuariivita boseongensis]|uniref:DUF6455 family protein n=1 Tax=Aestuariivita boseongensis TaxID=1470562 RepID=UPI0006836DD6|nr:DUF6455 family protein [Aestuariivita boseongensis]
MTTTKNLKTHAALVDQMAQAVGVDLEEAVLSGAAKFDELADAVLRCTGCSDPGHCAGWLAQEAERSAPPAYCRNLDLFKSLKAGEPS